MTQSTEIASRVPLKSLSIGTIAIFSAIVVVLLSRSFEPSVIIYVAVLSFSSAVVWLLLRASPDIGPKTVLTVTAILQIVALFGYTPFEDDWYRFIWDGWQTLETGTPYGKAPSRWFGNDEVPAALSPILDRINNPDVPTIYGPLLQFVFAGIYALAQDDPMGLRLMLAGANLAIVGVIMARGGTPSQAALYGWSPFVLAETVIHIHPDAIMALALLGTLAMARKHPILAGAALGLAAGTKIVALAAWPLMLRLGMRGSLAAIGTLVALYAFFAFQGSSLGFESTTTFASQWLFNPLAFGALNAMLSPDFARWAAALCGMIAILILHGRTRQIEQAPLALMFAIIIFLAPAVNPWYLLWVLPFAVTGRQVWPFAAMLALPLSYVTGQNLDSATLEPFEIHPVAWIIQIAIIAVGVIYDIWTAKGRKAKHETARATNSSPISQPHIGVIIPALNEERSIGGVVSGLLAMGLPGQVGVYVGNNGSSDATDAVARAAGARVVHEPKRGYGAACLAALSALPESVNIVLFVDADGSDTLNDAHRLIDPILKGQADIMIGSRALGHAEAGALSIPQRFGNQLATVLIWLFWAKRMTDLGPFRAIRRDTLTALAMADRDFGWTVEMQVKAARQGFRIQEIPTDYRCRIGMSKISGTVKGVILAGTKILYVIGREAFLR